VTKKGGAEFATFSANEMHGPAVFNHLEIVLVLHHRLLSWNGSRVSPHSCPLHYPAVTYKPAATQGPHCGAFNWWF
jgi:hypothetical protein